MRALIRLPFLLCLPCLLAACTSLNFLTQAVRGHYEMHTLAVPVETLLQDPRQPEQLRERLSHTQRVLAFAFEELHLPDNGSYRHYSDLGRPYAVWTVVAAPPLSVHPKQWCYPFTGCVSYRGYFTPDAALRYGRRLRDDGYDVYVGGTSAYSTLGWFADPLLNTFISRSEDSLAELLFHELAHQKLYIKGDSRFNEAFAVAVAEEGMRRWFQATGRPTAYRRFMKDQTRLAELNALLLSTRRELATLYATSAPDAEKLREKSLILDGIRTRYASLKSGWDDYDGYDAWINSGFDNARLALTATYHEWVPAFRRLLAKEGYDLPRFYAAAATLGQLDRVERTAAMESLRQEWHLTADAVPVAAGE